MERIERQQSLRYALAAFTGYAKVKGRRLVSGHFKWAVIFSGLAHCLKAAHSPLPAHIDYQVARDGEEPGIKAGIAVELRAAHQHAHPGLLEKILGHLAVPCEVKQIAQQAMLILDN